MIINFRFYRFIAFRLLLIGCSFYASTALASEPSPHRFSSNMNVLGNYQSSGASWLSGGLGRFAYGEESYRPSLAFELNAEYRYRPLSSLEFKAYVQAQESNNSRSASQVGIVELAARYSYDINFNQQVRVNVGQFFLPTSMENIDQFWESPYTLSFSSLNSWIGEEFRPIGLDLNYRHSFDDGNRLSAAVTPFWGNDSMGALLAYRGWSYGRQRTAYNDVLSVPKLMSLSDSGPFAGQRDDGTKPFGHDLDGKPGYALRANYLTERLSLNLTWVDNMGDTTLIDGEYAWRTKFSIAGASWFVTDSFEVLAEASSGSSTMGAAPGVDISFYSAYLMASYRFSEYRLSARYDQFGIDDRDAMDQENNELGRSYTLALMWAGEESQFSVGAEILYLDSKRTRFLDSGDTESDTESVSLGLLVQYQF